MSPQVNTTEHSLRYCQDKSKSLVAGTVLSPEKDGSKPVDGSHRNDTVDDNEMIPETMLGSLKTVFSGKPGALSMLEKISDSAQKPALLAALISEDLPLHLVSRLAFMFNFQDGISLGGIQQHLCIQADNLTDNSQYTSAWSAGFGLSSVGVTQIVG